MSEAGVKIGYYRWLRSVFFTATGNDLPFLKFKTTVFFHTYSINE
jgi:hypothetical protein